MTKLSKRLPDDYVVLLAEVKERIRSAQYEALKAVNKEMVVLRRSCMKRSEVFTEPSHNDLITADVWLESLRSLGLDGKGFIS